VHADEPAGERYHRHSDAKTIFWDKRLVPIIRQVGLPAAARVHDRDVAVAALAIRAAATLRRDEFASDEAG